MREFKIDFFGKRKIFFVISATIIAVSLIFTVVFGVHLSINFKGGSIFTYSFEGEIDQNDFQSKVEAVLNEKVSVQRSNDINTGKANFTVTLAADESVSSDLQAQLTETLTENYKDNKIEVVSTNVVNPTMGHEFLIKSLFAILFASLLMVIYVAFRFRKIGGWSAGVMAVVALLHDVLVIYATFVIFRIPINDNFIAVVLTILGYSLNDTIVIYDRIRENRRLYGSRYTLAETVNKSVNQTLGRTLASSFTTIMTMVIVSIVALIFRVDTILSFSFPLIIGLVSGSYSSIALSSSLWVMWQNRKARVNADKKKA